MVEALLPRLVYTVAFGFCALWCIRETAAHHDWVHRSGHLLHLLMSVAMIVMVWPAGMASMPLAPQVALFGVATLWFVSMAVISGVRRARGADVPGAMSHLPHAVMMGAMTWHLQAMAMKHAAMHGTGHAHHGHHGHEHHHHPMPAPEPSMWDSVWQVAGLALFAALAAWGVYSLVQTVRHREERGSNLSQAVMSIGMVALTLPLLGLSAH